MEKIQLTILLATMLRSLLFGNWQEYCRYPMIVLVILGLVIVWRREKN